MKYGAYQDLDLEREKHRGLSEFQIFKMMAINALKNMPEEDFNKIFNTWKDETIDPYKTRMRLEIDINPTTREGK